MQEGEQSESGWDRRRRRVALHIEGVALDLFAARGYRNVTVVDVAEAAGVATRTVARYFPLKEDLLLSLPRRTVTGALDELAAAARHARTVRELWQIWSVLARGNADDVQRLTLFWNGAKDAPEILDRARGEQHLRVRHALTILLRGCLPDTPDADLHAAVLAAALQAANQAIVEHWMQGGGSEDLSDIFTSVTTVLADELGSLDGRRRRRRAS